MRCPKCIYYRPLHPSADFNIKGNIFFGYYFCGIHYISKKEVRSIVIATQSKVIADGKHIAVVKNVEERTEPFHYLDVQFEIEETAIKHGMPFNISSDENGRPTTKLAKFLHQLGFEIVVGTDYTVEMIRDFLIEKEFALMTMNETSERGTFARVVEGSVKVK